MSRFKLESASGQQIPIDLGQVDIGLDDDESDPVQMVLTNIDKINYSEIRVGLDGEAAKAVQLARDLEGFIGTWAAAGEEIIARVGVLPPNHSCEFWARISPNADKPLGQRNFEFVVKSVATVVE